MAGPWEKYSQSPEGGPWAKYAEKPGILSDMAQSGLAGVRRGVESAIGGFSDVADLNARGASWVAEKLGAGEGLSSGVGEFARTISAPGLPTRLKTSDIRENVTDPLVGEAYEPQTTGGEYARTIGEFLPGAAVGQGSLPSRLITQALMPALGSETAGQLTKGTGAEPYARIAGALAGGIAPSLARRLVTPFPASPERLRMADTLADEGVNLTAGQRTGSEMLRYMESELGGMAGQRMMEQQGEQFTSAALRRAGVNAPRATPEVIDDAFTQVGRQFDDLAARNTMVPDRQFVDDLRAVLDDYGNMVPETARAPAVEGIANDIVSAARRGGIAGDAYQALRSRLEKMARSASNDPQLSEALRGMRSTLDDTMERSIAAANPADAGAWREVRNQYRNLLVLEKAATGAGENAAAGIVSPSQLRNATVTGQGRRNYVRGQGDFAELARAGEGVMKPLPNSGTASRTSARNLGGSLSALVGGGVGATISPAAAIAGILAGGALPAAAGRAMLSGPGRAYLGNQLMAGQTGTNPAMKALLAALLGSGQARTQLTAP